VEEAGRRDSKAVDLPERHQLADPVTFDRVAWPRRTERLSIRPATEADLPTIFAYRALPEVAEWMPERPTSYPAWLMRFGRLDALPKTLVMEREGGVVGDLYLRVEDAWAQAEVPDRAKDAQAEIGWCLSPDHQGKGYVTEAAAELLRICFEDLAIRRVTAVAFADNAASVRIMEKLGMQREALHHRESLHRDLGWVDSVVYAVLDENWR
jgi:RimJ/RimL family protein N-acetyltransferase